MVRAIAEAMFSEDGEVEPARLDAHVGEVDAFVSAASKTLRFGLRVALALVRFAPVLFLLRLRTLERLPLDERVAVLRRLERSRLTELSLAFIGWRTVMTIVFYEHPSELRALGYAGEERSRHRRLPVVAPALAAPAGVAPPPEESGVRLKGDETEEAASSSREVA